MDGDFPELGLKQAPYPHCNSEVLHAPSECYYCDKYPDRQKVRAASGTPFTPNESNGWSGNVAAPKGELHSHMGAEWRVGANDVLLMSGKTCTLPPTGFFCKLPLGHDGSCPTYARLWKKIELKIRTGYWWP